MVWLDNGSRVSREAHARFCERPRGKFPRPTHQVFGYLCKAEHSAGFPNTML